MNRSMLKNPGYDMDKDLMLVSIIPARPPLIASPKSGVKTWTNSSRSRAGGAR